jgi:hypothetical protein
MGEIMNIQHQELAQGRWQKMSLCEQMAHIGSEVSRALSWQKKKNREYCLKAVNRGLELIDLSLGAAHTYPRLKEIGRLREALVDYFYGSNAFSSNEILWRNYFDHFNYAVRK